MFVGSFQTVLVKSLCIRHVTASFPLPYIESRKSEMEATSVSHNSSVEESVLSSNTTANLTTVLDDTSLPTTSTTSTSVLTPYPRWKFNAILISSIYGAIFFIFGVFMLGLYIFIICMRRGIPGRIRRRYGFEEGPCCSRRNWRHFLHLCPGCEGHDRVNNEDSSAQDTSLTCSSQRGRVAVASTSAASPDANLLELSATTGPSTVDVPQDTQLLSPTTTSV